ncbi:hypothetical protein [Evansella clarkii]|nr:hypothetical protein [Evansella clarkii]
MNYTSRQKLVEPVPAESVRLKRKSNNKVTLLDIFLVKVESPEL